MFSKIVNQIKLIDDMDKYSVNYDSFICFEPMSKDDIVFAMSDAWKLKTESSGTKLIAKHFSVSSGIKN